jgi:hypothetical protein
MKMKQRIVATNFSSNISTGIWTFVVLLVSYRDVVIPPDWQTWALIAMVGGLAFLAQTTLNKGGQMVDATKTSLLRSLDIAFALMWQIFFFSEIPTLYSGIGIVLILGSTLLAMFARNTLVVDSNSNSELSVPDNQAISIELSEIKQPESEIDKSEEEIEIEAEYQGSSDSVSEDASVVDIAV